MLRVWKAALATVLKSYFSLYSLHTESKTQIADPNEMYISKHSLQP
jgi:hypothetical protein